MVKIIINGEAHNSSYAPQVALRDLTALVAAGKIVVCAVEDPELTKEKLLAAQEGRSGFIENLEMIAKAIALLKARNIALYDKITSDEEGEVAFSRDEISLLSALLDETGLRKDIKRATELAVFIGEFDQRMIMFGGYERGLSHAKFLDKLVSGPAEVVVIDDLEAAAEIYDLQAIDRRRGVTEPEKARLAALLQDHEIEERRTSTMAAKIFDKAKTLPEDGVVYVYPIGNSHVAAVAKKLAGLGIGEHVALEIHASCLWDKREDRDLFLAAGAIVAEAGMRDLFLSEPRCGGYDELMSGVFSDVRFPELVPSPSPESASGKSAVGAAARAAVGGAGGSSGGAGGAGRY